ncbi:tyrosine-type recombinase/integrase [Peribacillus castrilensis]|uniref:tyrosine-type recombinase/integrase n=1 Tax=Peribacillus TaxID=2675229 RepID=UPI0038721F49
MAKPNEYIKEIRAIKCQLLSSNGHWVNRWMVIEDGIPIQDVSLFLLDKAQNSVSTAEKYAYQLVGFLRYLKKLKIHYTTVNAEAIRRYIRELLLTDRKNDKLVSSEETNITYAALYVRINTLTDFYDHLLSDGKVKKNPVVIKSHSRKGNAKSFLDGIINPNKQEKTVLSKSLKYKETRHWLKWYTDSEIEKIVSSFRSFRDKVIFLITIETGMRIGEILGLKVCEFHFRDRKISINRMENPENNASAKTGSRIVPISYALSSAILRYLEGERLDSARYDYDDSLQKYLFLTRQGPNKGRAMTTRNYLNILKTAGASSGFDKSELRTHSGRSTTIQRLLNLIEKGHPGISIPFMEEILGLKEVSFKHYKKPLEARVTEKMANTLDNITPLNQLKEYNQN